MTGSTYHFSSEKLYTVRQIVFEICKQMNVSVRDFILFEKDRPGKDSIYKLDSKKTRKELNWKANVSLKNGIYQVIKYINMNFHSLKKSKLKFKIN